MGFLMKNLLYILIFLPVLASSQGVRYVDSLFSVDITSDILYGNNENYDGTSQDLLLDLYQPEGDTLDQRPLIIFAHGGSFLAGNKENPSMVTLCTAFAEMGYVTASINYRLGVDFGNVVAGNGDTEFIYATLRGTHDMRAAVRFFRKDAATTNEFAIDTSIIIAGGSSAGGFMGVHTAYLDRLEEVPEQITNIEELGGIPGNSGNPGYSSDIVLALNLCGAVGDTVWIEQQDTPLISMHGTDDNTVPYGTGNVELFGVPVYEVHGSGTIDIRMENADTDHAFYTFQGAGHVPYDPLAGDDEHEMYMDTTIQFVKTALYERFFETPTFTDHDNRAEASVRIYPNPSSGRITLSSSGEKLIFISLYNSRGDLIVTKTISEKIHLALEKGIYFLHVRSEKRFLGTKKIIIQ